MSSWGPGLFSSDIALDVKEDYINRLKLGDSDDEAIQYILNEYFETIDDADDSIDFWLSFSSVLFDYGRLTSDIKSRALEVIKHGDDHRWNNSELKKRKKVLLSLEEKLTGQQPTRKVVKKVTPYKCPYKPGDVFMHSLNNDAYSNYCFYILIDQVVPFDVNIKGLGDMYPIIYIKYSSNQVESVLDLENCEFIETDGFRSGEHRIQLYGDGFKKFFKSCTYIGNYNFSRVSNIYDKQVFIMNPPHRIDEIITEYLNSKVASDENI